MAHGRIVNVVDRQYGSRLDGDLASGATVIPVDDVFLFNEAEDDSGDPIGVLQIGNETYEYVSTDDDASTITLVSATTADYEDQDWVSLFPVASEKYGIVELDGGGTTEFLIPFLLWAWVEEANRGDLVGEQVRLSWDGQQYVYENLLGVPKKLSGAVIDPESTIPPEALTDGLPPSGSPTPVLVQFAVGVLGWAIEPIDNPDPVRYRIYADTVDPPTQDSAHLVFDGSALGGAFADINGVSLLPADPETAPIPYCVVAVAYDADGDAPVGATSNFAAPRRADNRDISADYGYFGEIEAWQIAAGSIFTQMLMLGDRIELDGPNSTITIYDVADPETRVPLVQLRPDGSIFRGQVIADDISVLNGMILQGLFSHIAQNAGLTLDASINDPATGPVLTTTPLGTPIEAVPSGYAARGITWDGTNWLRLIRSTSATTTKVQIINTSGVVTDTKTLTGVGTNANGIVKLGSSWFINVMQDDGFGDEWRVKKYATTGGAPTLSGPAFWPSGIARPAIGTDGTGLLVAFHYYGDDTLNVVEVDPSDLSPGGAYDITYSTLEESSYNCTFVGRGNFDFGANRFVVAAGTRVAVFTAPGGVLTEQTSESFDLIDNSFYGGMTWDGSNFWSARTYLNKYNGYYPGASEKAYVAHRDNNGADHTKVSPIASIALKKRWYVAATLAPAPSGAATPSVWMKLATSAPAATALLARAETITDRNVLIDPATAGGSALTTDTNTFGGGTAAWIKSQIGGLEIYGDGVVKAPKLQVYSTRYTRASNQSLTAGSVTTITFTANDGTNPTNAGLSESSGSVTVSQAGLYRVTGVVAYANGSDATRRNAFIYVNGTARVRQEIAATNGAPTYVQAVDDIPLAASDVLTLRGRQNSAGSLNVTEAALTITRVGDLAP